ncbi:Cysteine-rich hydrophobic domain containing protein 1 [Dissostichus eleginoides]|uniref:Cysteine-rich hydrophobic domain containing protein 1 n=1 Tax=Dissostichus eleginoides TaxID=100907 RepID=A0AAD9CM94_DISEL|nr:Cysteine-rich hydrophobic domain containing protein 1 [Dissostichus eleginoides]
MSVLLPNMADFDTIYELEDEEDEQLGLHWKLSKRKCESSNMMEYPFPVWTEVLLPYCSKGLKLPPLLLDSAKQFNMLLNKDFI